MTLPSVSYLGSSGSTAAATDREVLPQHLGPFKAGLPALVFPLDPVPAFAVCPQALQVNFSQTFL